jgi:lambda repressor-like predicted transcriptional regulator
MTGARLSLEPLVRRYGSVSGLARALGRDRAQLAKWRRDGLPIMSADRLAVAVGMHPVELWPDWYEVTEPHADAA